MGSGVLPLYPLCMLATCMVELPLGTSRQRHVTSTELSIWKKTCIESTYMQNMCKNAIELMYADCILTWQTCYTC